MQFFLDSNSSQQNTLVYSRYVKWKRSDFCTYLGIPAWWLTACVKAPVSALRCGMGILCHVNACKCFGSKQDYLNSLQSLQLRSFVNQHWRSNLNCNATIGCLFPRLMNQNGSCLIGHFAFACSATWPLNVSEAGGDQL